MSATAPAPALHATDPELAALVDAETGRRARTVSLIPSENHASAAVRAAAGSVLADKYSEGYPGRRYYEGNAVIDRIEALAAARAKSLFGAEHANVQPYSGSPANLAAYLAFLEPGDTVLGMALDAGGHLTHGHTVSATGRWFRAVRYGVRRDTGRIDLDEVRRLALQERPKLIMCGGTAIPRAIDFAGFADVAREAGALLLADIAHLAGPVAAGLHPSPVPHADVVMSTTHKTLRGPRGALLLCRSELAEALDRAVFPGLQGGPHDNTTAAIAVALHEAAQPAFRDYTRAVLANAQVLADTLRDRGFDLVSGGTDTHLLLVDLTSKEISGGAAAEALNGAGLVCNRNAIPFDPRRPRDPSGIRLGTPAATTRGMGPAEMRLIGGWIDAGVEAARRRDGAALERIGAEVSELAAAFPPPA